MVRLSSRLSAAGIKRTVASTMRKLVLSYALPALIGIFHSAFII